MATTKRMFSNDIVGSDAFFDLPSTSQNLYFHLGMRCDDDGFVNPSVTMRMTGANKNDLDVLVAKRFLLPFKNGVVVIKHHRINNNWDARDSRRTLYTEELKLLFIKENRAYTFDESQGISVLESYPKIPRQLPDGFPTGIRRQKRIEENRIEEKKVVAKTKVFKNPHEDICKIIKAMESIDMNNSKFYNNHVQKEACDDLITFHGLETVLDFIPFLKANFAKVFNPPNTPVTLRNNWVKVIADIGYQINKQQSKRPIAN